jgi:hypothetical protein
MLSDIEIDEDVDEDEDDENENSKTNILGQKDKKVIDKASNRDR